MTPLVKICGLSTIETVNSALAGGASFIGFVFFERSPRLVRPEVAGELAKPSLGRGVRTVAVTVDPEDERLDQIVEHLRPDLIQLHGQESPARVVEVRARTGAQVIKAVPVATSLEVASAARDFDGVADHLMFDARPQTDRELPGGNGSAFDWDIVHGLRLQRPWFLAGGLDPWNAVAAAKSTLAPVLDVSSGVERGAGLKDPALISAFLSAVRNA